LAGGYDFHRGNWTFGPIVSAEFSTLDVASYTEQGANALNLKVGNDQAISFKGNVGAHVGYDIKLSNGVRIHPEARVSLQHEFLNNDRNITSSFAQGNGPSFGFNVRHPARNTLITGVGVTVDFSDRWSGYVNYTGQLSSDQTSHTITAGMKMTW
jgi:outer membrane autotransporter protein